MLINLRRILVQGNEDAVNAGLLPPVLDSGHNSIDITRSLPLDR
jgi:hypothetical protein